MANLTETAYLTRKAVKYGIYFIIFLIALRIVVSVTTSVYRALNPPAPPPPDTYFGNLPAIKFPKKEGLPKIEYQLETVEGSLPQTASEGKVYFMPQKQAKLFSLEETKRIAGRMGFRGEPRKISATQLLFETGGTPNTTLVIDMVTNEFELNYDFVSDQEILSERKLPSDEQAVSEAKNFLSQAGLLTDGLREGTAKVTYFKLEAPNLIPAISLSEADFVRVNLSRKDLNDLKILPANPLGGNVSFLISGSRRQDKRIVKIEYFHQVVDEAVSGTYPLRSSNAAWQELMAGGGWIASLGDNEDGEVTIRKVHLAYFESNEVQEFLQPIIVFEGDNDFYAYVPAVDPKWIE